MSRLTPSDFDTENPYLSGAYLQDPSRQSSRSEFRTVSMDSSQQRPGESSEDVNMKDERVYPEGLRMAAIVGSLFSSIFIVAVSQTVLAAAIPVRLSILESLKPCANRSHLMQHRPSPATSIATTTYHGTAPASRLPQWLYYFHLAEHTRF